MRAIGQTTLRLVPDPYTTGGQLPAERISFCSHCATRPAVPAVTRVCGECGLGVLLQASMTSAPEPGAAFLVADSAMSICAMSRSAEQLLEITEVQAVHRHLTELLTPADTEAQNSGSLAFAISAAAGGVPDERRFTLRPANMFGVRLTARIASCGPQAGALIVLAP